ncbi:hypothetical protein Q5692_31810 [Microcoleus sp. C2C3]|uniref:hypothetical protein n=1 Tax=unclassified Microcoleus TaxID=2642155 RepID=UPI002FD79D9A
MSLNCKISRFLAVKSEINNRRLKLDKSIVTGKFILPFLTTLAVFSPCSAWGFTLNGSDGKIEFSVRPVELPSPNRKYDPTTTSTSVEGGLLTPGEGYPEISLEMPNPPIRTKESPLTLSDVWDDPRGIAKIKVQTVTLPTVAGIIWNAEGVFLDDLVADQSAARNASFGSAEFTTTISGPYTEFAFLNVQGRIDPNQEDAWVVGSLMGHFGGAAAPHTLEILFGFDGANRGREDFIKAYLDGQLNPQTFTGFLASGTDTFNAQGVLSLNETFPLKQGDKVTIEGTFSCVGFNGGCTNQEIKFSPSDPDSVPTVPEPSSMLGLLTFGIMVRTAKLLKHRSRKR